MGDDEFAREADPYRRELLVHCYRMLGSVHDAEDLVQETYLRAWRSYERFDQRRAALRTWLYRIATNACLTALERRGRRPLPSGLGGPGDDPEAWPLEVRSEVPWLQPIPDAIIEPGEIVAGRSGVRLAFIAALQHLPARQRAVLILRDVLAWRAAEVAALLDTTTAAVNGALQRARAQIAAAGPIEDEVAEPAEPARRELLDRYVRAFESADMAALEGLLRADAVLEMPPYAAWYRGRTNVARFITRISTIPGPRRMFPTAANGQPALAVYTLGDDGRHHAHSIQVITMSGSEVAHIVSFLDPDLFPDFDQPKTRPAADR